MPIIWIMFFFNLLVFSPSLTNHLLMFVYISIILLVIGQAREPHGLNATAFALCILFSFWGLLAHNNGNVWVKRVIETTILNLLSMTVTLCTSAYIFIRILPRYIIMGFYMVTIFSRYIPLSSLKWETLVQEVSGACYLFAWYQYS